MTVLIVGCVIRVEFGVFIESPVLGVVRFVGSDSQLVSEQKILMPVQQGDCSGDVCTIRTFHNPLDVLVRQIDDGL